MGVSFLDQYEDNKVGKWKGHYVDYCAVCKVLAEARDVGAVYECEGLAAGLTPRSDRALALDGARGAPAAFDCTYLDERVWIGRDDRGAAVVFAREP